MASLLLCLMVVPGCVLLGRTQPDRFDYFRTPAPGDPWSAKILGWQRRERADQAGVLGALPAVGEGGADAVADDERATDAADATLRGEYASFLTQRRRAAARELAEWVQDQAKSHYVADGPIDHWATLEETLRADGDDCDGLELLAFHGLRELGFDSAEVFRSIVYRPSDGQHHMVTLWFEDADDPWVIDPTGAMSIGLRRMSQLPEWRPLKIFTESREYSVETGDAPPASLAATR